MTARRFEVVIDFSTGPHIVGVQAADPHRALELAEIDARMLSARAVEPGDIVGFSVKLLDDVDGQQAQA